MSFFSVYRCEMCDFHADLFQVTCNYEEGDYIESRQFDSVQGCQTHCNNLPTCSYIFVNFGRYCHLMSGSECPGMGVGECANSLSSRDGCYWARAHASIRFFIWVWCPSSLFGRRTSLLVKSSRRPGLLLRPAYSSPSG